MRQSTAVVWLRRDLRLSDNPALIQALQDHDRVLMLYIHSPDEDDPWQPGAASRWWLHHSLVALNQSLAQVGSGLVIRQGQSLEILKSICGQTDAAAVYWNRLYEPASIARDSAIKTTLSDLGIDCHSFNGSLLREPWQVSKQDGSAYRVYTPFCRSYMQMAEPELCLGAPEQISSGQKLVASDRIEDLGLLPAMDWDQGLQQCWTPGEVAAQRRLQWFVENSIVDYAEARDMPSQDGISRLSPHLHFGELSPRQVWHEVRFHSQRMENEHNVAAIEQAQPYLRQLIWRDFAHHILFHFPHTAQHPFNSKFDNFDWHPEPDQMQKWQRGGTGIPLVDAGMRELWQTGWMHNRVRMVVASFLTKNCLIHWLDGARWFWDTLVDANLANNSMGWQWTAGCGVDAAPYFRIFNPVRQGQRFDKLGKYVRHWVPELRALPDKYIHAPWTAPTKILGQAGIALGKDYPQPIVDLSISRQRALEHFKRIR